MWNAIYIAGTQSGYTANSEMASFSVGAIIIFVRLQTRFAEPDKWNFTVDEFNFNELVDRQSAADCSRLGRWAKLSDFPTLHLYNSELKYYLKYELVYAAPFYGVILCCQRSQKLFEPWKSVSTYTIYELHIPNRILAIQRIVHLA